MQDYSKKPNDPFFPQTMSAEELAAYLQTDLKSGLSLKSAKSRRRRYGKNVIRGEMDLRFTTSLKNQFKGLTYLLFLVISFILYLFDPKTVYLFAIFAIPLILLAGAFLETRAASELNRLNQNTSLSVTVLREGREVTLDSRLLVPGEVIWLSENKIVPADCRIVADDGRLLVLETPVSGSQTAVRKSAYYSGSETESVSPNMLYAGTILRQGSCYAVVCLTGAETLTRRMHRKKETFFPLLLRQVRNYSRLMSIYSALAGFLIILLGGLLRKWEISSLFLISASLCAASLCDSLIPISLASFVHHLLNMSDDNLIVRNQDSLSLFASVDTIMCTKERMLPPKRISLEAVIVNQRLVRLDEPPERESTDLLKLSLACSDYPNPNRPVDKATLTYLKDACVPLQELTEEWFRMDTGRDEKGDVSAVLSLHADHYTTVVKGPPEFILSRCVGFAVDGKEYKMNDNAKRRLMTLAENASRENAYLLAVASGMTDADNLRSPLAERRLIFRGILVFRTTVEVDIANAAYRCRSAGIETVVATEDPYYTAVSVGKTTGVIKSEGEVISGREIKAMDYGMFVLNAEKYHVFLEPEPDQWLDVLHLRRNAGHVVSVTGESADELTLLHDASISVVPMSAPDVLRESSDYMMRESGLHVLADGITHAKALCFRLRWIRQYLFAGTALLFTALLASALFGTPPAFGFPEILFGGLISNLAIAVCIAFSSTDRKILAKRLPPFRGTVALEEILLPLFCGVGGGICAYAVYALTRNPTACMITYLLLQFFYACGCLWPESLFRHRRFGSRPLWILLAILIGVFALLLLVSPIRSALGFSQLSWTDLAYSAGFSVFWHLAVQAFRLMIEKSGRRKRRRPVGIRFRKPETSPADEPQNSEKSGDEEENFDVSAEDVPEESGNALDSEKENDIM